MGDPLEHLRLAVDDIDSIDGVEVTRRSSVYRTEPLGRTDQPDFLNAVIEIETGLSPFRLLESAMSVEEKHGRARETRWGPRTLDVDILLFGEQAVAEPDLVIPHPRMTQRRFVLEPLLEIAPDLVLPDGESVEERLKPLAGSQRVAKEGEL